MMKKNVLILCIAACGLLSLVGCNTTNTNEPENNQGNEGKDTTEVVDVPVPNPTTTPKGAIAGVFRVSDSRFVWFSQGNLQYNAAQGTHRVLGDSTIQGTWRFAEHQSDYVGADNALASSYSTEWIDLFGWGTSGWNGAVDVKDSATLTVKLLKSKKDTIYFTPAVQEWYRNGDTIFFNCYNANGESLTNDRPDWARVIGQDYFVCTGKKVPKEVYFYVKQRINYAHLPWDTGEQNVTDTTRYYPAGNANYSLAEQASAADWGVYNAISNGGNEPGTWRTLTSDEWLYLFDNNPWTMATIIRETGDSIFGMILLPCNYTPVEGIAMDIIGSGKATEETHPLFEKDYADNVYTMAQLEQLQTAGVVFLPSAGRRRGAVVEDVGLFGEYWSSTVNNTSDANRFGFYPQYVYANYHTCRYIGISVRLVQDIKE